MTCPYNSGPHRKNHKVLSHHEYHLPSQDQPIKRTLDVALVSGMIGDYTCYVGIGELDWVIDHGNKVPFHVAEKLFPGINEKQYRL